MKSIAEEGRAGLGRQPAPLAASTAKEAPAAVKATGAVVTGGTP